VILVAGLSYYNDLESMKRTIESLLDNVDYIICVDGRYSLRVGEDYSTDGSTEYLESLGEKVIVKKFVGYEPDKRNVYMEEASRLHADALIGIDTDEYMDGDWDKFKKDIEDNLHQEYNFLGFTLYITKDNPTPAPRVFLRPDEIRFYKAHNYVIIKNDKVSHISVKNSIEGMVMHQDDDLRNLEWLEKTQNYQQRLVLYEKQFRAEFFETQQ
jgi:hypothetical protein